MVLLLDWTEFVVFNKVKPVDSVRHSLYDEIVDFKWVVLGESEKSKHVNFDIKPNVNAFSFPKNIILNKNKSNIFVLKVDARKLPDNWSGELNIKSEGIIKKIGLDFEKIKQPKIF